MWEEGIILVCYFSCSKTTGGGGILTARNCHPRKKINLIASKMLWSGKTSKNRISSGLSGRK